jgi:hypothetical protein
MVEAKKFKKLFKTKEGVEQLKKMFKPKYKEEYDKVILDKINKLKKLKKENPNLDLSKMQKVVDLLDEKEFK